MSKHLLLESVLSKHCMKFEVKTDNAQGIHLCIRKNTVCLTFWHYISFMSVKVRYFEKKSKNQL